MHRLSVGLVILCLVSLRLVEQHHSEEHSRSHKDYLKRTVHVEVVLFEILLVFIFAVIDSRLYEAQEQRIWIKHGR